MYDIYVYHIVWCICKSSVVWICDMNMWYEYVVWICGMNMWYEYVVWICGMNMWYEYVIWICDMNMCMNMWYEYVIWICGMNMWLFVWLSGWRRKGWVLGDSGAGSSKGKHEDNLEVILD